MEEEASTELGNRNPTLATLAGEFIARRSNFRTLEIQVVESSLFA